MIIIFRSGAFYVAKLPFHLNQSKYFPQNFSPFIELQNPLADLIIHQIPGLFQIKPALFASAGIKEPTILILDPEVVGDAGLSLIFHFFVVVITPLNTKKA
jgi:hypothetical protein